MHHTDVFVYILSNLCLCKKIASLPTFQVEGVIGITVDEENVVLVHVNEAFSTKKVLYR